MTIVGGTGKPVLVVKSGGGEIDVYINAMDPTADIASHNACAPLDAL